jgi:hypothetical protein
MKHDFGKAGCASETSDCIMKLYDGQNVKQEDSDTLLCSVKAISLAKWLSGKKVLQWNVIFNAVRLSW